MTTAEKMTRVTSKMAGGMKKVLGAVRPAAEGFAKGVEKGFTSMATQMRNSTLAGIQFMGLLKTIKLTEDAGSGFMKDVKGFLTKKFPLAGGIAGSKMVEDLIGGTATTVALANAEGKLADETGDIDLTDAQPISEIEKQRVIREERMMAEAEKTETPPTVVANVYLNGNKVGDAVTATVVSNIGGTQDRGILTSMAG